MQLFSPTKAHESHKRSLGGYPGNQLVSVKGAQVLYSLNNTCENNWLVLSFLYLKILASPK